MLLLLALLPLFSAQDIQPDLIHIAPGDDTKTMVVTWSTREYPGPSILKYGTSKSNLSQRIKPDSMLLLNKKCLVDTHKVRQFCTGALHQFVHKVKIKNLKPNTTYYYRCGKKGAWSKVFNFTTVPKGNNWPLKIIVYGDMGVDSESRDYLIREAETGQWRMFFHNGDIAYNLETSGGQVGDTFLRQIQPIAAHYPYLVSPGNHEQDDVNSKAVDEYRAIPGFETISHPTTLSTLQLLSNFTNYKIRFQMPGNADNLFYSYKIGLLLLVVISTEPYVKKDKTVMANQNAWLKKTLKKANEQDNRRQTPWIIVFGHRPMYCSTTLIVKCPNVQLQKALEDLFYKYGVDVVFWAHEHAYERMYPVYKGKAVKGGKSPYVNPKAPIHFISGAAGNILGPSFFLNPKSKYIAYRSIHYGYTRLTFYNSKELYIEQVSVNENGNVIDKVLIRKEKHGPYP